MHLLIYQWVICRFSALSVFSALYQSSAMSFITSDFYPISTRYIVCQIGSKIALGFDERDADKTNLLVIHLIVFK